MPLFRSRTIQRLKRLIGVLPRKRVSSFLYGVLPLSILSGLVDLSTVAVGGRLAGSLMGNRLEDTVPGINFFSFSQGKQAITLVVALVILSWFSSISKLLRLIFIERLTSQVWRDFSNRVVKRVVGQPYEYFINTKSNAISEQLLLNLSNIAYSIVSPLLLIISSSIVLFSIAIALSISLGKNGIILLILLALSFLFISSNIVPYMRLASKQRVRLDILTLKLLNQIFFSIRDIHLTQTANYFESKIIKTGDEAKRFKWRARLLPDLPRLIIEPLAITFIFTCALLPVFRNTSSEELARVFIPFVATFVIAAAKMTPPLQDLFRSIITVRGTLPQVDSALKYLELPAPIRGYRYKNNFSSQGIFPRREISLRGIAYQYPNTQNSALKTISLNIPVGSRIALMGPTGSGKTTLSNILLCHLEPTQGLILLDGIPIEKEDILSWQLCCAEVPQNITLVDGNIIENVAFGSPEEQVNLEDVWDALSGAQMYDIVSEMPHGLYTSIGENGIKLSGGQRQRIALARAFYRKTNFLILDEATSSLDEKTESDVINSLEIVGRRCTTVVIAHRLKTLAKCDYIYEINEGTIYASGTYKDLCDPNNKLGNTVKA